MSLLLLFRSSSADTGPRFVKGSLLFTAASNKFTKQISAFTKTTATFTAGTNKFTKTR